MRHLIPFKEYLNTFNDSIDLNGLTADLEKLNSLNESAVNEGLFGKLMDKIMLSISKKIGGAKDIDQAIKSYETTLQQLIINKKYQPHDANFSDGDNKEKVANNSKEQEIALKKLQLIAKKVIAKSGNRKDMLQDYYDMKFLESEERILDFRNTKGYLTEDEKLNFKAAKAKLTKERKAKAKELEADVKKGGKGKKKGEGEIEMKANSEFVYTNKKGVESKVKLVSEKPNDKGEYKVQSLKTEDEWYTPKDRLKAIKSEKGQEQAQQQQPTAETQPTQEQPQQAAQTQEQPQEQTI